MLRAFFFLLVCILLGSCGTSATEPTVQSNYPGNVNSVIQANCMGGDCHSKSTTSNAGLDLSTWEKMTSGSIYFNDVIPFTAVKSHLFGHVNTNSSLGPVLTPTMPLARNHLSAADQMTIFNWINQGAKSADGKIPYSEATKKIFVVNQNEDMVSVIDADTKRLIRIISVGTQYRPAAIAMMPDLKTFIVAMAGAKGVIRKYDAANYSSLGECISNLVPSDIAITPDGSKGYMTDDSYSGNRFGVFDPLTMQLTKTISSPLLVEPLSVAVSPDGKYAYICGHGSDNIVRIDTRTDSVMGCLTLGTDVPVPVPNGYSRKYLPQKIVISADSKTMYVTSENTSEVVVFDLTRDSIIARIPTPILPCGAALTPDGSELWTAEWGSSKVHVISTATNQVLTEIDSVGKDPHAITITPDGAFAYVVCEFSAGGGSHNHGTGGQAPSSYVVIECKTRKIVTTQDLPGLSIGITAGYK